jgi:hypothetical protein
MTLMRFDGRALRIDQAKRQVSGHVLWGRPRGSLMPVRGCLGRRDGWQPPGGCLHVARCGSALAVYP